MEAFISSRPQSFGPQTQKPGAGGDVVMNKLPPRTKAAFRRVDVAFQHLANALREIQAARADLSSVIGAPQVRLDRLMETTLDAQRMLQLYAADVDSKCELDHDPTLQELRCGHGPRHGCGRR